MNSVVTTQERCNRNETLLVRRMATSTNPVPEATQARRRTSRLQNDIQRQLRCVVNPLRAQIDQARRHGGALVGLASQTKLHDHPNWNMKHYKSVESLSNIQNSSPPAQTQSPPLKTFWYRRVVNSGSQSPVHIRLNPVVFFAGIETTTGPFKYSSAWCSRTVAPTTLSFKVQGSEFRFSCDARDQLNDRRFG